MQASPFFDKSQCQLLSQGSLRYEKCLTGEQLNFFTIGRFAMGIKNASKNELQVLTTRLDYDAKAFPRKAYFFNALLSIVKRQLKND